MSWQWLLLIGKAGTFILNNDPVIYIFICKGKIIVFCLWLALRVYLYPNSKCYKLNEILTQNV